MKTQNIVIGAAFAVALSSSAAAQDAGTKSGDRANQPGGQSKMTVTGCLTSEGGQAAGGAATSTSPTGDRFVLMNATAGSTGARSSTSAGAAGSPSTTTGAGSSYILEGKTADLRKHLNHQVEITGRVQSGSSDTSARQDASTRPGASTTDSASTTQSRPSDRGDSQGAKPSSPGSPSGSSANSQRLEVDSVRMIASSCSK